jgi:hypothetical protein
MFTKGDKVQMTADALENYGAEYAGVSLAVTHVADKYMPAREFFAKGQPDGYHCGLDCASGDALYELEELEFPLYERELEPFV